MRRIFWDAPVLIYLTEGHPAYLERISRLLAESLDRGDTLLTSWVALGEVLVGAGKRPDSPSIGEIRSEMDGIGFQYVEFTGACVNEFCRLRVVHRVKTADAIHLACAAAAGTDLFLTHDLALTKLHVPGIKFIDNFRTALIS